MKIYVDGKWRRWETIVRGYFELANELAYHNISLPGGHELKVWKVGEGEWRGTVSCIGDRQSVESCKTNKEAKNQCIKILQKQLARITIET